MTKVDKVAILGTVESWRNAPFREKDWEIWASNANNEYWKQVSTRWFEIHQLHDLYREGWENYKWLTKYEKPVYMAKHYSRFPTSIRFPIEKVSRGYLKVYSSTFCYQLALAIYEGFKTIGLFGIDFSNGSLRERMVEWRGVLYWLGVAAGKGIKIEMDKIDREHMEHQYLYGLQYWDEVIDVQFQILRGMYATSKIDGVGSIKGIWKRLNGDWPLR